MKSKNSFSLRDHKKYSFSLCIRLCTVMYRSGLFFLVSRQGLDLYFLKTCETGSSNGKQTKNIQEKTFLKIITFLSFPRKNKHSWQLSQKWSQNMTILILMFEGFIEQDLFINFRKSSLVRVGGFGWCFLLFLAG